MNDGGKLVEQIVAIAPINNCALPLDRVRLLTNFGEVGVSRGHAVPQRFEPVVGSQRLVPSRRCTPYFRREVTGLFNKYFTVRLQFIEFTRVHIRIIANAKA